MTDAILNPRPDVWYFLGLYIDSLVVVVEAAVYQSHDRKGTVYLVKS